MPNLADRIADVLRSYGVGDECLVDWSRPDRLAAAVVEELTEDRLFQQIAASGGKHRLYQVINLCDSGAHTVDTVKDWCQRQLGKVIAHAQHR